MKQIKQKITKLLLLEMSLNNKVMRSLIKIALLLIILWI